MANTYRPVSARAKALHGEDVFDAEFTASDEKDHLDGGHLELVPRPYRVLVNNFAAGKEGDVVDLALLVEQEGALVEGGFLERSDKKKAAKKSPSRPTDS